VFPSIKRGNAVESIISSENVLLRSQLGSLNKAFKSQTVELQRLKEDREKDISEVRATMQRELVLHSYVVSVSQYSRSFEFFLVDLFSFIDSVHPLSTCSTKQLPPNIPLFTSRSK
jgi:hypothetical protein